MRKRIRKSGTKFGYEEVLKGLQKRFAQGTALVSHHKQSDRVAVR